MRGARGSTYCAAGANEHRALPFCDSVFLFLSSRHRLVSKSGSATAAPPFPAAKLAPPSPPWPGGAPCRSAAEAASTDVTPPSSTLTPAAQPAAHTRVMPDSAPAKRRDPRGKYRTESATARGGVSREKEVEREL